MPARADKVVHFLAPIMVAVPTILALGVIPYGRNMTPFAIDGGILFFFAVGSATELAVFMAGWGSNNKFSMLGAMRAIAQMVSYELPLVDRGPAGRDGRRLAFARRDRRGAKPATRSASSRTGSSHAMGRGVVPPLLHLRAGGIEPHAVRCAGRRVGNRRRSHDGIFRLQIRDVLSRGILRDVRDQRAGRDDVPRRLACAVRVPAVRPVLHLVLRQARRAALRLHLDPRHAPAHARRSRDELRVEVHAADGVRLRASRRPSGTTRRADVAGWLWSAALSLRSFYFALSRLLETRRKFAPRTYRFAE